jgi:hypothetical protein
VKRIGRFEKGDVVSEVGLIPTAAAATFVAAATAAAFVAAATTTTITAAAVAATTTAATITAAAAAAAAAAVATAAAAFTAVAAATAAAARTTAAGLEFFRLRGVDAKLAALIVVAVESLDGSVQLALVAESHESKSFGSAGFAVGDDFDPFNRSVSGEEA